MYLAYFDESGDDEVYMPEQIQGASQLIVYSNVFIEIENYKRIQNELLEIRRKIKGKFKVSFIQKEFHTRDFLLGKNLNIKTQSKLKFNDFRKLILLEFAKEISKIQGLQIFSTVLDKAKHKKLKTPEDISEKAICCSLNKMNYSIATKFNHYPDFIMISDMGRENTTRKIVRKIQKYSPIYTKNGPIDGSIKNIIEDCLFKDSKDSYFLQLADFMAYFTMLWVTKDKWDNKLTRHISFEEVDEIFNVLSSVLNTNCSKDLTLKLKGINFV